MNQIIPRVAQAFPERIQTVSKDAVKQSDMHPSHLSCMRTYVIHEHLKVMKAEPDRCCTFCRAYLTSSSASFGDTHTLVNLLLIEDEFDE